MTAGACLTCGHKKTHHHPRGKRPCTLVNCGCRCFIAGGIAKKGVVTYAWVIDRAIAVFEPKE